MTVSGGNLSGAVSFRKPITFALSFGLLLWATGWVMDRLKPRRFASGAIAMVLAASAVAEVGLVALQAWRGVPSHFNFATPFDAGVFSVMGVTILASSLALVALAVWAVIDRPREKAMSLGIVAGLTMVLAGLGLGVWVIGLGVALVEATGLVPDTVTVGGAGVAKFPHALALHGLQLFIVTWAAAAAARLTPKAGHQLMRLVVGGYGLILVWSTLHTNSGLSPLDLRGAAVVILAAGLALLVGAAVIFTLAVRRASGVAGESLSASGTLAA
jgi:cytochrome c oxidase assembly factor CtaG